MAHAPPPKRVVELLPVIWSKEFEWPNEHGEPVKDRRQQKEGSSQVIDANRLVVFDEAHFVAAGACRGPSDGEAVNRNAHAGRGAILVDALTESGRVAAIERQVRERRVHDEAKQI